MRILAIETSCDETAIALVEAKGGINPPTGRPQFKILKNLVASQIKIHRPFGGVVPTIAKREHLKNLPILLKKLTTKSQQPKIDLLAVTVGPGLEPALWTGINFAEDLHKQFKAISRKPSAILGVSHLDGHLYSFLLQQKAAISNYFPAIALIVSGGHTTLIKMDSLTKIKLLGETVDDAAGEAFDKVARLLDLPYPGGPEIEKLAKEGNPNAVNFPRPMLNQKNYNFSFSGLKTAVLYYLRGHQSELKNNNYELKTDVAASFQRAAFDVLIKKTLRAAREYKAKSIFISGGVAANKALAKEFKKEIRDMRQVARNKNHVKNKSHISWPIIPILLITKYPTDNAAMIAAAAYINYLRKKKYPLKANGNLNI